MCVRRQPTPWLRSSSTPTSVVTIGSLGLAALILGGCAGPAIRSQSPEIEALAHLEADTKLVGDYTAPWGLNAKRIERPALVTGLADTGSDPPPGPQRQTLLADMQARGVVEPSALLASPSTSLAWAHGYLPPGVRKGDRFDIFVEVPADNDTVSLAGGWLMETRLAEMAVIGNTIRDGHELGIAAGPLLVDPVSGGTLDSKSKIRARVPGGGVALRDRDMGLVLAADHRSFAMSKRLGDWINRRFHAVIKGVKRGVANPQTDRYIALEVPPVYRHNLGRYIRVVQNIAVIEPPGGRHARLQLLERQLTDPITAPIAALRLEAIGKEAIPTLRKALESTDGEIRFAAAESLAYLGESVAAPQLAEAATSLRSARPAALAALTVLDDANGVDSLQSLLASRSAETRYGAFRALWRMDPDLPLVRGERLGDACSMHVLDVDGPPLVHATRSIRPEFVFFGTEHPVADGLRAEAGTAIVVVVDRGTATVSRFVPGQSDQQAEVPAGADAIVRAIIELGGTYADAIQFLQQASASRSLASRLAFDSLPDELDGRPTIHQEASARNRDIPEVADDPPAADDDERDADDSA
ncbi:MAG: HEAT repeat domain-containing protein [Planctomycetia bacterium]|nr:HEAT repeat domain-containing protein [Planctomycetia bacterium]